MIRLAYACIPRTGRMVWGQYPEMSGLAIAGTLASTRSLLGFSHVFSQSSILYGPRTGTSSEVFTEGVVAVALAKSIRLWTWVGLLCFDPITFFVEVRTLKPTELGS